MSQADKDNCNKIILKRFKTRKEAIAYEMSLHNKFNVDKNKIFWNKAKQTSTKFSFDSTGIKRTKETKEKLRQSRTGTRDSKVKEYDIYEYATNKLITAKVSLYHFALDNNVDASSLYKTTTGRLKKHKGLYVKRSVK